MRVRLVPAVHGHRPDAAPAERDATVSSCATVGVPGLVRRATPRRSRRWRDLPALAGGPIDLALVPGRRLGPAALGRAHGPRAGGARVRDGRGAGAPSRCTGARCTRRSRDGCRRGGWTAPGPAFAAAPRRVSRPGAGRARGWCRGSGSSCDLRGDTPRRVAGIEHLFAVGWACGEQAEPPTAPAGRSSGSTGDPEGLTPRGSGCRWSDIASLAAQDQPPYRSTPLPETDEVETCPHLQDREKALEAALSQIDRQFGKGSVMRLGDEGRAPVEVIPTGSIALDVALGIGGLPARPRRRDLRPGVLRQDDASRCTRSPTRRRPAASRPSSTPSTRWTPSTPRSSASTPTRCSSRSRTPVSRRSRSWTC